MGDGWERHHLRGTLYDQLHAFDVIPHDISPDLLFLLPGVLALLALALLDAAFLRGCHAATRSLAACWASSTARDTITA